MNRDSRNSGPRQPKIIGDGEGAILPMNEGDLQAISVRAETAEAAPAAAPQPHGRASEVAGPRAAGPVPTAAGELSAPAGELCAPAAPGSAATGLSGPMPTATPSSVGLEDWPPGAPDGATIEGPVDEDAERGYYRRADGALVQYPTFWADQMRLTALHIAVNLGIPIFPCWETGPKAKAPRTKKGFKVATVDGVKVSYWWQSEKQAMIGMPTGPASRVFVIDIDVKNGADGFAALAELEARYGPLPQTKRVRTPSGGAHIYFNMPVGVGIFNSTSKVAPGIDVRADGGYVILPPSRILDATGKKLSAYEWEDPNETVADCPEWLLSLVTAKGGRKKPDTSYRIFAGATWQERSIDRHCRAVAEAPKGSRNETLNKAGFALGQLLKTKGFERDAIEARLLAAARASGLPHDEARATIQSGLDAGLAKPSEMPVYPDRLKNGAPDSKSTDNVRSLLAWLGVELRCDRFTGKARISGLKEYRFLNDDVLIELWAKAQDTGFRIAKNQLGDTLSAISLEHEFHPVRDYFDSLEWDGIPRVDGLLSRYFGAEETDYMSAISAKTMIAAVRRIRQPGAKFDQMIVLEGPQGSGKSTALKILAIKDEWFTDGVALTDDSKIFIEQTEGKLIVEVPELKGMRRAEMEHVKATLSRTSDRARRAYGRYTDEVQRQFIMVATANLDEFDRYLKDHTGNRRFWPVKTTELDLEALKQDRDQIWAEAADREAQGESIELPRQLWAEAEIQQQARMGVDPWKETLEDALGDLEGKVLVEDVWDALGKPHASQRSQFDVERLGRLMRELGWKHTRGRIDGRRHYFYAKGNEPYQEVMIVRQPRMETRAFYPPDQQTEPTPSLRVV